MGYCLNNNGTMEMNVTFSDYSVKGSMYNEEYRSDYQALWNSMAITLVNDLH